MDWRNRAVHVAMVRSESRILKAACRAYATRLYNEVAMVRSESRILKAQTGEVQMEAYTV